MDKIVAELAAKDAIRNLVLLYSRAIDRKDYDLVRSLYAADATDTHGARHFATMDEFIEALREVVPGQRDGSHIVGNHLIAVEGDEAEGEVYVVACHLVEEEGNWRELIMRLRYIDRYRKEDERWRFAARTVIFDHTAVRPVAGPQGDAESTADPATLSSAATSSRGGSASLAHASIERRPVAAGIAASGGGSTAPAGPPGWSAPTAAVRPTATRPRSPMKR